MVLYFPEHRHPRLRTRLERAIASSARSRSLRMTTSKRVAFASQRL